VPPTTETDHSPSRGSLAVRKQERKKVIYDITVFGRNTITSKGETPKGKPPEGTSNKSHETSKKFIDEGQACLNEDSEDLCVIPLNPLKKEPKNIPEKGRRDGSGWNKQERKALHDFQCRRQEHRNQKNATVRKKRQACD